MEEKSPSKVSKMDMKWEPAAKRCKERSTLAHASVFFKPLGLPRSQKSPRRGSDLSAEADEDLISCLPQELALQVLSQLEAKDLLSVSQTCRTWRTLAEDDVLWRIKNRVIGIPDERTLFPGSLSFDGFQRSLWKMNYIRYYRISQNWRNGTNRLPRCISAHKSHLITCLLFTNDNRIVSGSDDSLLKVWSVETGQCVFTLSGHSGGVWTAEAEENLLVSGATDRTVRVWDLSNGDLVSTWTGHSSTVRCLALKDGICISGSRDFSLRIWSVGLSSIWNAATSSHGCKGVLLGHTDAVRCVRYDGVFVVSGSYDHQIRVWNPLDRECLHVLSGHTHKVYSLQFDGIWIVSGSFDTTIRVWDVKTGVLKHVLMGHESLISGMHQRDHIVVSGNADCTMRLWDIRTGVCLQTLGIDGVNKHESGVTCVQFAKNFVVTSSDDGTVKLWDLQTGMFIRNIIALPTRDSGGVVWKIVANKTKLICAVGSRDRRNPAGIPEETKIVVFDFETNLPTWGHDVEDNR